MSFAMRPMTIATPGLRVTQHFIKFSQRVVDRLTHHGSSIKWLRADFCDSERKSYGEE